MKNHPQVPILFLVLIYLFTSYFYNNEITSHFAKQDINTKKIFENLHGIAKTIESIKNEETVQQNNPNTNLLEYVAETKHTPISFEGISLIIFSPSNDEYVGKSIQSGNVFEPQKLSKMLNAITPGTNVLDIGANFGSYSVFFAAKTGLKGNVYAFEPQKKMCDIVKINAFANKLTNLHSYNVGVSFEEGVGSMSESVMDGVSQGKSLREAVSQNSLINYGGMAMGQGGEKVYTKKIDSFHFNHISLMKIDVQGMEPLVFYGARETIRSNLPVIFYEDGTSSGIFVVSKEIEKTLNVPPNAKTFDINSFLMNLGYRREDFEGDVIMYPPGK